jgi:hypothetical protein
MTYTNRDEFEKAWALFHQATTAYFNSLPGEHTDAEFVAYCDQYGPKYTPSNQEQHLLETERRLWAEQRKNIKLKRQIEWLWLVIMIIGSLLLNSIPGCQHESDPEQYELGGYKAD